MKRKAAGAVLTTKQLEKQLEIGTLLITEVLENGDTPRNKEIAARLGISEHTVKRRLAGLFRALKIKSPDGHLKRRELIDALVRIPDAKLEAKFALSMLLPPS